MWIPISIVGGSALSALIYRLIGKRRRITDDGDDSPRHPRRGPAQSEYPPGSRPAGPGAEGMNVPAAGEIVPGDPPPAETRPI